MLAATTRRPLSAGRGQTGPDRALSPVSPVAAHDSLFDGIGPGWAAPPVWLGGPG